MGSNERFYSKTYGRKGRLGKSYWGERSLTNRCKSGERVSMLKFHLSKHLVCLCLEAQSKEEMSSLPCAWDQSQGSALEMLRGTACPGWGKVSYSRGLSTGSLVNRTCSVERWVKYSASDITYCNHIVVLDLFSSLHHDLFTWKRHSHITNKAQLLVFHNEVWWYLVVDARSIFPVYIQCTAQRCRPAGRRTAAKARGEARQ